MASALLFNVSDPLKRSKIRFALSKNGVSAKDIPASDCILPIGTLAGMVNVTAAPDSETEDSFTDEMLVLCHLTETQFDRVLNQLRQDRVVLPLKAVLTETNAGWNALRLHREILAEHEAMRKSMQSRA